MKAAQGLRDTIRAAFNERENMNLDHRTPAQLWASAVPAPSVQATVNPVPVVAPVGGRSMKHHLAHLSWSTRA